MAGRRSRSSASSTGKATRRKACSSRWSRRSARPSHRTAGQSRTRGRREGLADNPPARLLNSVSAPPSAELAGRHIVLGLSGGIACYKAAELTRALIKAGATVQVVMTDAAEQIITAVTL